MRRSGSDWTDELERWLAPFLERLGNKTRRRMCPRYVAGLIGSGDRKSVQPMAARFAPGDYDQLHHFIAAGVWARRRWRRSCLCRPIGWSAAMRRFWLSTTRPCRRRGATSLAWPPNTPQPWARRRIANLSNRPVRTRMPGSVAGERSVMIAPYAGFSLSNSVLSIVVASVRPKWYTSGASRKCRENTALGGM